MYTELSSDTEPKVGSELSYWTYQVMEMIQRGERPDDIQVVLISICLLLLLQL
jgi:hypothetical protein